MTLLFLKENDCAKWFWNQCINVEGMAQTISVYDQFIIWSSSVTLIFNLPVYKFQMALLLLKKNHCAKLFWNACINVEVMAWTSSILTLIFFDLLMWPWPSTYLNKCFNWHFYLSRRTKLFWNPCINVEGMDQTISIHVQFIIWSSSVTLIFNYLNVCFKWHCYSSRRTTVPNYFEMHAWM